MWEQKGAAAKERETDGWLKEILLDLGINVRLIRQFLVENHFKLKSLRFVLVKTQ